MNRSETDDPAEYRVRDRIRLKILHQARDRVRIQVGDQIWSQDQIWSRLGNRVYEQAVEDINGAERD
jgi:hypothetical protein